MADKSDKATSSHLSKDQGLLVYDPDPVSIIALMVGIVGAIPGAIAIRDLPSVRRRLTRNKWERTKATINEILDELNHLEVVVDGQIG